MGTQNLNGSGLLDESLQEEIEFLRGEISSESLIIKILAGAALMLSTMVILKKILVKQFCSRVVYKEVLGCTNLVQRQSSPFETFSRCDIERISTLCCTYVKGTLLGLRQFLITESHLKMKKNAFYFTLKAFFVLKIFNFLS